MTAALMVPLLTSIAISLNRVRSISKNTRLCFCRSRVLASSFPRHTSPLGSDMMLTLMLAGLVYLHLCVHCAHRRRLLVLSSESIAMMHIQKSIITRRNLLLSGSAF